jgi:glucokinase
MIIAVDIGGTKIRVGYSRLGDYLEDTIEFDTPVSQRAVVPKLIETINLLVGSSKIDAIGVASPASINKTRGTIVRSRNLSWQNLRITLPLKKHFGCPVAFEHDATAAGIAEARSGAGKDYALVLYVTISTGIGSSIIFKGQPLSQKYNSQGGDQIVKDDYSNPVAYYATSSGRAIEHQYKHPASGITKPATWKLIARDMATGLYNMITIVQPDCVVLGGGVSVHYNRFIKPLKRSLGQFEPTYALPPIKRARYVETAPMIGMLLLAAEELQ